MEYDCVLMLTWSDWKTEARSNRYHFASRFAENVPVFFCQPIVSENTTCRIERTELPNVDIVHTPIPANNILVPITEYHPSCSKETTEDIKSILRSRGLSNPLIWIYNTANYFKTIQAFPNSLRVLHATEDYFTSAEGIYEENMGGETIKRYVQETLHVTDLLIAVSQGVLDGIGKNTDYCGERIVVENGVDTKFFSELASEKQSGTQSQKPIAIYQGAINHRIDYELLESVINKMPDWDFWFCGAERDLRDDQNVIWKALLDRKNVSWFGNLLPEEFGTRMLTASVGIIPFVQNEWIRGSAPLKSFEYLACDLPVVSVPIRSLEKYPDHFKLAKTDDEFVAGIRSSLKLKNNQPLQESRKKLSEEKSYDRIFKSVNENISEIIRDLRCSEKELNTLILYDENSTHVNTIEEHLLSFKKYSKNTVFYLPATGTYPLENLDPADVYNLDLFDVIIIHYSVRLSLRDHLNSDLIDILAQYSGIKVLFIQDEYDTPEIARQWIERLNIDLVYTCVRAEDIEYVYPKYRFQTTEFLQTLTGYIPENIASNYQIPDIDKRNLRIGYRGRKLPLIYGSLGNEKYEIGLKVKEYAEKKGIPVDIEVDDSKRIYGDGWYSFLGSARATLGTESGSNVFDNDGSIADEINFMLSENPEVTFDEVFTSILAKHEKRITMNQISPKIFESILFRTALVLFEGEYSGVVQPEIHYIPLKKDFSNIDSVFEKLENLEYLEHITDRAYSDVIDSGLYSYQSFVEGVDADLDSRTLRKKEYDLFPFPAIARNSKGEFQQLLPASNLGLTVSTEVFPSGFNRTQILARLDEMESENETLQSLNEKVAYLETTMGILLERSAVKQNRRLVYGFVRRIWRLIPQNLRFKIIANLKEMKSPDRMPSPAMKFALRFWHFVPTKIKLRVRRLIR